MQVPEKEEPSALMVLFALLSMYLVHHCSLQLCKLLSVSKFNADKSLKRWDLYFRSRVNLT